MVVVCLLCDSVVVVVCLLCDSVVIAVRLLCDSVVIAVRLLCDSFVIAVRLLCDCCCLLSSVLMPRVLNWRQLQIFHGGRLGHQWSIEHRPE